MKTNWLCHILISMVIFAGGITIFPNNTFALQDDSRPFDSRPVLIITDVSGSMQDETCVFNIGENKEKRISKINALKKLLLSTVRELNGKSCEIGIYRMRYLAGDSAVYLPFLPIAFYDNNEITDKIKDEFVTEYPVFNRRTPIADTLRQLDKNELEAIQGRITIVLISDGNETFYDIEDEWDREEPETDDDVKGPLTEVRRLVKKYGNNLNFYTIYIEDECDRNRKADETIRDYLMDRKKAEAAGEKEKYAEGEFLMAEMASSLGGKGFLGSSLLKNESLVKELAGMLCDNEKPKAQTAPPAQSAPPPPVITAGPKDSDGDGIYDNTDECPGTPKGAKVNEKGCWVLEGINFDTAKWNIKPEFHLILDSVVNVLMQNPGIMVEVQGHTDNKGSTSYNKRLSERRAASVMTYLIENGIEANRLSSIGYGLTKPMFPNNTSENRAKNRRVELEPKP